MSTLCGPQRRQPHSPVNRWLAEGQEWGSLVHVQMTSVPLPEEVTGPPFAPGDRQRDFLVDLCEFMLSKQDVRQLLGRKPCLRCIPDVVLVLALQGVKHEPHPVITTSRDSGTGNHASDEGESFDFCPLFPRLSQNLIKAIHLGLCMLPDTVSGPSKRWYFGAFKPFKSVLFFLVFSRFLFCCAPWHTCSCLIMLPVPFGSSKVNMTCPDSVLPSGTWLAAIKSKVEIKREVAPTQEKAEIVSCTILFHRTVWFRTRGQHRLEDTSHPLIMVQVNESGYQQRAGNHFLWDLQPESSVACWKITKCLGVNLTLGDFCFL